MNTKAITCREVAEILGVSPRTVWNLVARKQIPAPKKIGRLSRWHPKVIDQFLFESNAALDVKGDNDVEDKNSSNKTPGRPRNTHETVKL